MHGVGGIAGVSGIFRADEQRDFTFGGAFLERAKKLGEFATAELFVELGDFAGDAGGAVAKNFAGVGDAFRDAVRGFIKNDCAILDAQALQGAAAFASPRGQKADKEKFFVGQAACGERREKRGWARHGNNRDMMTHAKRDEPMSRIGNQRHARVADESDLCALFERDEQLRRARQLVMLVVADEGLADLVVVQQLLRVARVFARDLVDS